MAVLSLFESMNRGARPAGGRGRRSDLGRLSRERRLALYVGACRALGLDPKAQPLRFVRCTDGRLRLFDPTREPMTPTATSAGSGMLDRLERELAAARAAIAGGGGVAYEIDLATGDLRVREVLRASRWHQSPASAVDASVGDCQTTRAVGPHDFAAAIRALRARP